jgi:hypothetical protein
MTAPAAASDRGRDAVDTTDARVVDLRSKGKSFAAIARILKLDSARDALSAFNRGIRARPAAELTKLRAAEMKRLDGLAKRVRARAELGADDIARRLKRVDRMRADLLAD